MEQPNRVKVIVASNEYWMIPAGILERRFLMLDVSTARQQQAKVKALKDCWFSSTPRI